MKIKRELYNYYIVDRTHRALRKDAPQSFAEEYANLGLSPEERMTRRFEWMCQAEEPHIHPDEKITFMRTVKNLPTIFTDSEWEQIKAKHFIHELGFVSNLSPNFEKIIKNGLLAYRKDANAYAQRVIDAILSLTERYQAEAKRMGREDVAQTLARVPAYGARNFLEALQSFRILHYALWLEGDYHNGVGRFDQYILPYFEADLQSGVYTRDTALALIEDFFLSFNKDSDLYVGVQQGDNGQSMMLGGKLANGKDGFNLLSELCLEASCNLKLIDPKINLRVCKDTPLSVYEKGTRLTRAGLGFPQYSNDDIVIDGLMRLGYEKEDAVNYVVAACWEFIIPCVGNDVANIGAVNFPALTDNAIRAALAQNLTYEQLLALTQKNIADECDKITQSVQNLWFVPSPFLDILRDGKKYNNFGLHGCGVATAADSLAAVKKYVYEEKSVSAKRLLDALDNDFAQDAELLHLLRYEAPKMGTDDDGVDGIATMILDCFAQSLQGKRNCLGGIWRAGTGTAMYYLRHASAVGATADGRRAGEPFGTNYSPSLFAQIPGPVTDIDSFTKPHLVNAINGGPLTLEFTASVFNDEESVKKVAMLVRYFIQKGGHQLQLNTVNLQAMQAAQKNPDAYRQLIVRIWGWSAYFVELDKEFQDHVMARQQYTV